MGLVEGIKHDITHIEEGGAEIGWSDIDIRDVVRHLDELDLTAEQLQHITDATEEFNLGADHYEKVHSDKGRVVFECKGWSALTFVMEGGMVYISESHPY